MIQVLVEPIAAALEFYIPRTLRLQDESQVPPAVNLERCRKDPLHVAARLRLVGEIDSDPITLQSHQTRHEEVRDALLSKVPPQTPIAFQQFCNPRREGMGEVTEHGCTPVSRSHP